MYVCNRQVSNDVFRILRQLRLFQNSTIRSNNILCLFFDKYTAVKWTLKHVVSLDYIVVSLIYIVVSLHYILVSLDYIVASLDYIVVSLDYIVGRLKKITVDRTFQGKQGSCLPSDRNFALTENEKKDDDIIGYIDLIKLPDLAVH